MKSALDYILENKLVAILRGVPTAQLEKVVEAIYRGGIRVLEITLNTEDALRQIKSISEKFSGKMLIGAGTVLDLEGARAAKDAGAKFLISPGLDEEVVRMSKEQGLVAIPGAFTPTEVMRAHKAGADIVKIFPVSNAEYIRNISAPLNGIKMMPTGGVNLSNIKQFKEAGAVAFGIGSALVTKTSVVDDDFLAAIDSRARALVAAISAE